MIDYQLTILLFCQNKTKNKKKPRKPINPAKVDYSAPSFYSHLYSPFQMNAYYTHMPQKNVSVRSHERRWQKLPKKKSNENKIKETIVNATTFNRPTTNIHFLSTTSSSAIHQVRLTTVVKFVVDTWRYCWQQQ